MIAMLMAGKCDFHSQRRAYQFDKSNRKSNKQIMKETNTNLLNCSSYQWHSCTAEDVNKKFLGNISASRHEMID